MKIEIESQALSIVLVVERPIKEDKEFYKVSAKVENTESDIYDYEDRESLFEGIATIEDAESTEELCSSFDSVKQAYIMDIIEYNGYAISSTTEMLNGYINLKQAQHITANEDLETPIVLINEVYDYVNDICPDWSIMEVEESEASNCLDEYILDKIDAIITKWDD